MFSQEVADRICERLAAGESLRTICKEGGDIPTATTVFRWLADDEHLAFREQYTRAREAQAHNLADEILHIADTPVLGVETKIKPDGERETTEGDMLGHRKLQVDSRKWYLSKVLPKVYGDKLELAGNSDSPLIVQVMAVTTEAERASAWKSPAK